MAFIEKVKDSLANRAAEGVAAALAVMFSWAAYQIAPFIVPAIESAVPAKILLALLVTSMALNLMFMIIVWLVSKKEPFRLKYGIYWDKNKNPYCPSCKTPLAAYGDYQMSGKGYYCTPCAKVFKLADVSGNDIEPSCVVTEL